MTFTSPKDSDNCQGRQIVDEATEWLLSLEDRDCEALRDGAAQPTAFLQWLSRSPEHIRVFLEISHAYYCLGTLNARDLAEPDYPAVADDAMPANVVNLKLPRHHDDPQADGWLQALRLIRNIRPPASRRSRWVVASLLAAVAIGTGTWLSAGSSETDRLDTRTVFTTQVGERSITHFEDGSAVYLNTATQMELRSERHSLAGRLQSGEVYFQLSPGSRSLRLNVDGLQVDASAGQLDVRHESGQTQISVLEGRLRLSCDCAPHEVVLPAGFQLRIDEASGLSRIQPQPITRHERDNLAGWRDGRLHFAGESLAAAATEFNRYNRRQLVVGDPSIAGLRIAGTFSANDVESFIAALVRRFGLQTRAGDSDGNDPNTVLLSPPAPPVSDSTTP
jgi:transmembrane sensor